MSGFDTDDLEHCFGGYILFANHFKEETPDSIREILASYQETSKVPLLLGVDEEGGTVNRVNFLRFHNSDNFFYIICSFLCCLSKRTSIHVI